MGVTVNACTSPISLTNPKQQPEWRPDAASDSCMCCGQGFSMWVRRRHHCRACGELVCHDCSPYWVALPELGYKAPVRVCKDCNASSSVSSPSTTCSSTSRVNSSRSLSESSDGEMGDIDDELVFQAVEIIAFHSKDKRSKLSYQYFVQSEAVSWLVDAGLMQNRTGCAALFLRLVDEGYVSVKASSGSFSKRSAFYVLSDDVCLEQRLSQYATAIHSETSKCRNCSQSFLELLTATPGFCSIDCKTNALISQSDAAKIRRYYS